MVKHANDVKVNYDAVDYWLKNNDRSISIDGDSIRRSGIDSVVLLGIIGSPDVKEFSNVITHAKTYDTVEKTANNMAEYSAWPDHIVMWITGDQRTLSRTFAHEAMHRAFQIINITPGLLSMMPTDMQTRWKGGWGHSSRSGWDVVANPGHCLISVALGDVVRSGRSRWQQVYFPDSEPRLRVGSWEETYDYWADMYKQIERVVSVYLQGQTGARNTGSRAARGRRTHQYEGNLRRRLNQDGVITGIEAIPHDPSRFENSGGMNAINRQVAKNIILGAAAAYAIIYSGFMIHRMVIKPLMNRLRRNRIDKELKNPAVVKRVKEFYDINKDRVDAARHNPRAAKELAQEMADYVNS